MKYENVYTIDEEHSHRFYQMPKELFINPKYRELSSDAKVLYSVLLDRKELSRSNKWVDKYKQVYLMYTRENIAELMCVSVRTVQRMFKQLNDVDLIIEKRQGLTKPNRIYICKVESHSIVEHAKLAHQNMHNWHTNDTDLNETEKIKRYTIQENGVRVLSYYNQRYEEQFNKPHPTVTAEQLGELEYRLECNMTSNDFTEEKVMDMIDVHFEQLSPKNDGKIFSFLGNHELANPMIRYADDVEYG